MTRRDMMKAAGIWTVIALVGWLVYVHKHREQMTNPWWAHIITVSLTVLASLIAIDLFRQRDGDDTSLFDWSSSDKRVPAPVLNPNALPAPTTPAAQIKVSPEGIYVMVMGKWQGASFMDLDTITQTPVLVINDNARPTVWQNVLATLQRGGNAVMVQE